MLCSGRRSVMTLQSKFIFALAMYNNSDIECLTLDLIYLRNSITSIMSISTLWCLAFIWRRISLLVTALPLQAYIINFTVIAVTLDGLLASIQSKSNCRARCLPIPALLQACFILLLRRSPIVIRAKQPNSD